MGRTGAGNPGPSASKLLDLGDPRIDWVAMATAMGVDAVRCETAEQFEAAFARAMSEPGPKFIEAAI
jgi:acetolactate synthase-1/2/3 large subunit